VTKLSQIDLEPKIGRYALELAADRQYLDFFPLDDPAELDRVPFFYPEKPDPGLGPFGQHMLTPSFRRYRHDALIAYEFADVHLLGTDGIVILDSGVVKNSLEHVSTWQPDSNVAEVRGKDYLRLRQSMPVTTVLDNARFAIGFNGAWRNHGHWLPQCLPKLYAFTLLRRRFRDLKVVLPPLPSGSAQARTLELLGIGPEAVHIVAPNEATCFASAILLPSFDIWTVTNFVSSAADAVIGGLPKRPENASSRPDKIYIHRTVPVRNVTNFEAAASLLARYGFTVVSFEKMDFAEQVATMHAARHVISEHGAGTANILFCRPGARVLELFNPFCVQPAFWSLASRRGLDYGYLVGSHSPTETFPLANWNSAYDVPLDALEDGIRATLRLPPQSASTRMRGPQTAVATVPSPAAAPHSKLAPMPPVTPMTAGSTQAAASPGQARALTPPPAAAPNGGISGIVEPIFEVVNNPARLGRSGAHERLALFAPAVPPPQLPMLGEQSMPADFVAEHYYYPRPPAVASYAVGGGVLWSTGLVTLGNQFVALPDCLPGYFHEHLRPGAPPMHPIYAGALGRTDVKTIALERPVAVATHPNLAYGHILLEVLPRLWLLAVLRELGADIPLALSRTVPDIVKSFAQLFHSEDNIVWYDGKNERLTAPSIVIPAMLHSEYNFHPALNLMVRELVQRFPPDGTGPALIYLAQANYGEERLENAADIEDTMRNLGFAIIRASEVGPEQQIRLFAGAKVLVAEYGFALYGSLFSPPGTRIVSLNFSNHALSAIGRLRRHRLAYVPPADGKFHHWRLTRDLSRTWRVAPDELRKCVQEMVQGLE
jgi:capsular polysaccharide biosynthesis protein